MQKVLFDCNYVTIDDKPVIKIFYKTKSGWEIIEDHEFKPYFYAIPVNSMESLKQEVGEIESITSFEEFTKNDVNGPVNVLKLFVTHPSSIPELRREVRQLESCKQVREADMLFHRRYLIDNQLIPMEGVEELNPKVAAIDLEIYLEHGNIDVNRDPITMLSYSDNRGISKVVVARPDKLVDDVRVTYVATEKELIETFIDWIKQEDVDILIGYNTDNFDFPYLKERAKKNKIDLPIGVDGSNLRIRQAGMNKEAEVVGRQHIDLYPVCRRLFNLPRYRLEDVYESITGVSKVDLELAEMNRYWKDGKPEEFQKLVEYSISDVEACVSISEAVIGLQYELSRIVGQPVDEVSRMGSGMRVEYFLMRKAHKENILVPNGPGGGELGERMNRPVQGAFVVDPVKGVHDNLLLFDFRSLYPSIIISHNVDPSTLNCECCGENAYIAPDGTRFCKDKKGFIPTVLREIIQKRIEIKNLMKTEKDEFQKKIYDVQQQAVKILANSAYGYFGFARARWYCRECAGSITGWGRQYIHETITFAEENGFQVVYGDTDSVYLTYTQEKDMEKIMSKSKRFRDEVNKKLPEAMELEFEGYYPSGVFVTKKRYALLDVDGKLKVKGLETRRRDWSDIAKKTQEKVLDIILREKDMEKAASLVKDVIQEVKTGKTKLEDLTIHTQLTRKIGDYVSEGPHVLAAKKAMKKGIEFGEGSIVSYVVTNRKSKRIGDKAELVEFVEEGSYDPDYYINNQILPAVMRVLEAFDYSEDELKGLGKQSTLSGW